MSLTLGFLVKEPDSTKPFKELDHTADLRVEIHGRDEQDLFRNAVDSLYHFLGLPLGAEGTDVLPADPVEIHGQDLEEALVALLGELLYRATVENVRLDLHELSLLEGREGGGGCRVVVTGDWQELAKGAMAGQREIKAVTYHDVQIRRTEQGFSALVVMDL